MSIYVVAVDHDHEGSSIRAAFPSFDAMEIWWHRQAFSTAERVDTYVYETNAVPEGVKVEQALVGSGQTPTPRRWLPRSSAHGIYWHSLMLVPRGTGPDAKPNDWSKSNEWVRVPALDTIINDPWTAKL
jgi:hypothetical protein